MNHLRANSLVRDQTLLITRIILSLLQTATFIYKYRGFPPKSYKYFTTWGMTITTLYYVLLMVAYILKRFETPNQQKNPYSPFRMWKWVTFIYQCALCWETIITIVYWSVLWPTEVHINKWHEIKKNFLGHLFPLIYLYIDYALNRYYFEWHQIWLVMGTFVAYGTVNISVTKASGKPVYGPLSWDSVFSWCLGLGLLPFAVGVSIGYFYLSQWKFKKLKMEANTVMFQSIAPTRNSDGETHVEA
jgi:hypothetical protein